MASVALAQSSPNFQTGQTLGAAQLNGAFQGKTDYPITNATVPLTGLESLIGIQAGATVKIPVGAITFNVTAFGAKCDNVTDDAVALNAALTAAGAHAPSYVTLPFGQTCRYSTLLSVPALVTLQGNGPSPGNGGLAPLVVNLAPGIRLAGNGSSVTNLYINAAAAGANTSGLTLAMANVQNSQIINVHIDGPCIGASVNGNLALVFNLVVNGISNQNSCGGWEIGNLTTQANTIATVLNSTVGGLPGSIVNGFGQIIYDAGGLYEAFDDFIFMGIGTYIVPGVNQAVTWPFFGNTVLGDTNGGSAFSIDTTAPTAVVKGGMCVECWVASQASATSANILINNGGGGTIDGFQFIGLRDFNSANLGAYINAGKNISFEDSQFCGSKTGQAVILVSAGIPGFRLLGGHVGGNCSNFTTTPSVGVQLGGAAPDLLIGNDVDFTGVTTAVAGQVQTFAQLPVAPFIGLRSYITDDNAACTFGTIATGGGAVKCPVIWNGTNWVAG